MNPKTPTNTPTPLEVRIDTINRYLPWDAPEKAGILRAVNAHEELLAALHKIAYEPIGPSDASDREVLEGMADIAKQAIAKAEKGE